MVRFLNIIYILLNFVALICILAQLHNSSIITTHLNSSINLIGIDDNRRYVNGTSLHCDSIECFISNDIFSKQHVSYIEYTLLSPSYPNKIYLMHDENLAIVIIICNSILILLHLFCLLFTFNK